MSSVPAEAELDQALEAALDVAVVQMTSAENLADNLRVARRELFAACERGAKLVVLPENFAYFGAESGRLQQVEKLGDTSAPIQAALADMARSAGCTLVAGGMPLASGDEQRPYNAALVYAPDGSLRASYRKIHLFDVDLADGTSLRESASTSRGDSPELFDVNGFQVGLSICYDVRFPELYRKLARAGADLVLVPAAFTLHTGKDHWHVLLRARAIENQCYVAAAAQWGKHPQGRNTYGHSLVVDPWGTVVAECSDGVGFASARVFRKRIQDVRASLPSLTHRVL